MHGDDKRPNRRCCGTTARQQIAAARSERPEWCGECDERTRLVDTGSRMRRCPKCHPVSVLL